MNTTQSIYTFLFVVWIISTIASIITSAINASEQGRNPWVWGFFAFIWGWLIVIILSASTSSYSTPTSYKSNYSLGKSRYKNATSSSQKTTPQQQQNQSTTQNVTPEYLKWECTACGYKNNPKSGTCINCGKTKE